MLWDGVPDDRLLHVAQILRASVGVRDRWYRLRVYENVFVGSEAVDWLVKNGLCATRASAVKLGQRLLTSFFIHHCVDDHPFQDKFLYYRFFVDEDAKYKGFWAEDSSVGRRAVSWRIQPRVACNSRLFSVYQADSLQDALFRRDVPSIAAAVVAMRENAKAWAESTLDWRESRTMSTSSATVYIPNNSAQYSVPVVKTVSYLPRTPEAVAALLTRLGRRSEWDAPTQGLPRIVDVLRDFSVDCNALSTESVPSIDVSRVGIPSALNCADEGPASDSDDELWHERIGRLVVASPFLTRVFPNIARRTAVARPYLATPPTIPETAVVEEEEDYRTATPLSAPGSDSKSPDLIVPLPDSNAPPPLPPTRIIYRKLRPIAAIFSPRDACTLVDCTRLPDGSYLILEVSVQHRNAPPVPGFVRAEIFGLVYLIQPHRPLGGDDSGSDRGSNSRRRSLSTATASRSGGTLVDLSALAAFASPSGAPPSNGVEVTDATAGGEGADDIVSSNSVRSGRSLSDETVLPAPVIGSKVTIVAQLSYKGRLPRYLHENVVEEYSINAMRKLRAALNVADDTDETIEGIAFDPTEEDELVEWLPARRQRHRSSMFRASAAAPRASTLRHIVSQNPSSVSGSDSSSDVHTIPPEPVIRGACLADFDILAVLGRGGYGKVMQVRRKDNGAVFAMKSLRKKDLIARRQTQRTMVERRILSTIDHPFIVSLKYAFQTSRNLFMVMDFVAGGDLYCRLSRDGLLSEAEVQLYMAELILALNHLHKLGIVYRDLKPENILIEADGHLKLTDFGLSRFVVKRAMPDVSQTDSNGQASPADAAAGQPQPGVVVAASLITRADDGVVVVTDNAADPANVVTNTFCGTEAYMAPEVLLQRGHTAAVDFWSLGILFGEMLTGVHPFKGPNHFGTLKNMVAPDVGPANLQCMTPAAASLLAGLLAKNPKRRLGSEEAGGIDSIRNHPFFAGMDWDAVLRKDVKPRYIPSIRGSDDISNFDKVFTQEAPGVSVASQRPSVAKLDRDHGGKQSSKVLGFLRRLSGKPGDLLETPQLDDTPFRAFSYTAPDS